MRHRHAELVPPQIAHACDPKVRLRFAALGQVQQVGMTIQRCEVFTAPHLLPTVEVDVRALANQEQRRADRANLQNVKFQTRLAVGQ
jgi:hypothetical protein